MSLEIHSSTHLEHAEPACLHKSFRICSSWTSCLWNRVTIYSRTLASTTTRPHTLAKRWLITEQRTWDHLWHSDGDASSCCTHGHSSLLWPNFMISYHLTLDIKFPVAIMYLSIFMPHYPLPPQPMVPGKMTEIILWFDWRSCPYS